MTESVRVYVRYEWDCPSCEETQDEGDIEPTTVECHNCGFEGSVE